MYLCVHMLSLLYLFDSSFLHYSLILPKSYVHSVFATFLFLASPPTPLSLFLNFLHPNDLSAVNDLKKNSSRI